MKTNISNLVKITIVLISGVGLTACGGSSSSKLASADTPAASGSTQTFVSTSSTSSTDNGSSSSSSSSSSDAGALPAASADFAIIGEDAATSAANAVVVASNVQTDDKLRIRVTPDGADSPVVSASYSSAGSNAVFPHRFVRFKVWVNNTYQMTSLLAVNPNGDTYCPVGGSCINVPHQQILSFPQSAGHGNLNIRVSNVEVSTYCELYYSWGPQYAAQYCTSNLYPSYHFNCTQNATDQARYPQQPGTCGWVTRGSLEIETNGTALQ